VLAVLGVADLGEHLLGRRLRRPGEGVQDVGDQANSRWVWHRSATSRCRASGRSSPSIATAVWVDLCGSTPMITVMEVLLVDACERHDAHS
jgi:hypothetical protein